ncbi:MAG: response regulator [Gammaproteobacteria bacterium HGW-Gammaproteobacteria-1]|jgi:CheY-like chemotaxis protein|nr:MAG: response regulator [Gammaproteobacteria bacterium HGW-Gammaproteobacteria-1]
MTIDLAKKTVLVIDDFQNMRATLRQMLLSIGVQEVDSALKAEEALERMRAKRYDIVLCDYNLGSGMDGQQLFEAARAEGIIGHGTIFIMVTAENSSEMVMGALEALPDAYLTKPFTKDLLRARLARALPRKAPLQKVDDALRKGDTAGAVAHLDRLLAGNPANTPELLRLKAELALNSGDTATAAAACRQALDARPAAWALTLLGRIAARDGQPAEAEKLFREAIALTPAYMAAHDGLAAVLEAGGDAQAACDLLVAAVERSAKSLPRQLALGRLAQALKKTDVAERAWRRAIALARQMEKDHPAYHAALAATLALKGDNRDAQAALKKLAQEFRSHPETPWWTVVAKLNMLGTAPTADRTALMQELDALAQAGPPPRDAAAQLAPVLRALGENERATRLA